MGCSGTETRECELKIIDHQFKEKKIEYYKKDTLFKIISNYISFYKNDLNKNYKRNIYLVNTKFFQEVLGIFGINLKNEEFNLEELKKRSFSIPIEKYKITLISSEKKFIEHERAYMEILNEEILKNFGINEKEYINKNLLYKFLSDEELEIIINNNFKIFMKKIDGHFQIIEPEKFQYLKVFKPEDNIKNSNNFFLGSTIISETNENKESGRSLKNSNNNVANNNETLNKIPPQLKKEEIKTIESNNEKDNQSLLTGMKENNNTTKSESNKLIKNSIKYINNDIQVHDIKLNNLTDDKENSKIKSKYELFFNYYKELFEEIDKVEQLLNLDIDSEKKYNDYAIVNKKYFNKLTKLFESDENFSNENFIIESIDKLIKIDNINIDINTFENRIKSYINNSSLFQIETEEIPNTKIKYPKEFILIKKDLLIKFGINQEMFKDNKFEILFGENYLFIKEGNNIFIYSKEKIFFNAIIIFECIKESYFNEDLVPNIKNKGGFEYFFNEIGFDFSKNLKYQHMKDENILSNIIIIKQEDKIQKEYLKQIILSLSNINSFTEKLFALSKEENDVNIITLFLNFIKNNKIDKDIINEIFIQIKNLETNKCLNDFRITIDLVLDKMHQQLNSNESIKYIDSIEDIDKNYVFSDFKNKFNSQNNTVITNIFFGIIMKAITPDCYCKEKTYICETSKYLYLNYENIEKHDKLEDILENWGKQKLTKYECKSCATECQAEISKNFGEYPEILIIITKETMDEGASLQEATLKMALDRAKEKSAEAD